MKALLLLLLAVVHGHAATLTLAWNPSVAPVAGYKLYYGGAHGIYTNVIDCGKSLTNRVTGLQADTDYFFVATSYLSSGIESDYSKEITTIPTNAIVPPPVIFLDIPILKATNLSGPYFAFTNLSFQVPTNLQGQAFFQFGLSISGQFYRPKAVPGFVPPKKSIALPPAALPPW